MTTKENVLSQARKLLGIKQYSESHKKLVNDYNSVMPLPRGYAVNYNDDWCDVFVSTIFIRANASHLIGRECGVERHINIFKELGIWYEDGNIVPQSGDIITFRWGVNAQPNDGFAEHIGIVEKVVGREITTIEGNSNNMVSRRTYNVGEGNIRGYARPKYLNSPTDQPKIWKTDLTYAGHVFSSEYINVVIEIGKKYKVLPSFMIVQLYIESNWGTSDVAIANNNLAGMTWTGNPYRPSGVIVQKGSPRPASEGEYYMKYSTIEDFFKDWSYLYIPGGPYNVSGQNFENAVKGLFTIGGAKSNYATAGYNEYIRLMRSVKSAILKENGQNTLNQIDQIALNNSDSTSGDTNDGSVQYYTVQAGDSLWAIAQRFNLTVDQLCSLNNITSNTVIHPGDKLIVSKEKTTDPQPDPIENEPQYYTVQSGDSLWAIAQRFNLTVDQLCALNNITSNAIIHPGDRLIVRSGSGYNPQPNPSENLIKSYSESATFTANTTISIRNGYSTKSPAVASLAPGDSVHYDSVYITSSYVWISYISYSGVRRYVAVRTYNNGNVGPIWGTIS